MTAQYSVCFTLGFIFLVFSAYNIACAFEGAYGIVCMLELWVQILFTVFNIVFTVHFVYI
jgi:hypothetical protein